MQGVFSAVDQGSSTSSLNVPVLEDMFITPAHSPGGSTTTVVQVAHTTIVPLKDSTKPTKRTASTVGHPQSFAKKNRDYLAPESKPLYFDL